MAWAPAPLWHPKTGSTHRPARGRSCSTRRPTTRRSMRPWRLPSASSRASQKPIARRPSSGRRKGVRPSPPDRLHGSAGPYEAEPCAFWYSNERLGARSAPARGGGCIYRRESVPIRREGVHLPPREPPDSSGGGASTAERASRFAERRGALSTRAYGLALDAPRIAPAARRPFARLRTIDRPRTIFPPGRAESGPRGRTGGLREGNEWHRRAARSARGGSP
jgi:hypothetical protein